MSQVSELGTSRSSLPGTDLASKPSPPPEKRVSFPNALSRFVFTRTYPRWKEEEGRRETYEEAVERYVSFLREERDVPEAVLESIQEGILRMDVMPSMRAFWSAGKAAKRDNTMFYNCSFIPLDSLKAFSELLYILMMGTGVGFSVEHRFVNNLPVVAPDVKMPCEEIDYVVEDSTVGWMDAVYDCLVHNYNGRIVRFDYSQIRPAGARLKTKGGRASGPEPLRRLLDFIQETVLGAQGRKLSSVECNDIACMIGEIVMAGGVRRAALISFSDPDDLAMRHAKDWSRGTFPECRYMANNSAFWTEKPNRETFDAEWEALKNSGSGERGFFMFPKAKQAERRGDCRSNPCGEILLRYSLSVDPWTGEGGGGQFCNLSAAVMRPEDTVESFANKIRVATWIGAIQSTFTDFPHLRPAWKQHCDEDRLLGVDITGHCDNPTLSGDDDAMAFFNQVARETAAEAAAYLDIPMPAAITCGKPSGNSSQMVDCASGFHTRYAAHYVRRVRIAGTDPLFHLIRDAGVPVFKDNQFTDVPDDECPTWVAEFPVKSPEGAKLRDHETAIEQLNRYLQIMRTWCSDRGHNQSATVYVREHEWEEVGDWVFKHFDEITGLSFLPYDGGKYRLAPYEEITEAEYNSRMADFPDIDWSLLSMYETEDMGEGAKELACVGGACEIDWDKMAMESGQDDVNAVDWNTLEHNLQEPTRDMADQED
jgi:ribonucleoside-diphosphate reductase alpha chain